MREDAPSDPLGMISLALAAPARRLLDTAQANGQMPLRWEFTFGNGAIEELGTYLRNVTTIERLFGLSVIFPEKPGTAERAVTVRLMSEHGALGGFIVTAVALASAVEVPHAE